MDWSIRFPHLGIYLEHVGKNFTVFGISIAYYGVIIAVGMLAGILLATYEAKRTGQNPDDYFDLAIIAIICSVIGARLYYVIFSWDLYKEQPVEYFKSAPGWTGDLRRRDCCNYYSSCLCEGQGAFISEIGRYGRSGSDLRSDHRKMGQLCQR